mgnify:CR=1 FL=1
MSGGVSPVRVGEFAAAAGVRAKTVRFYEEMGLLRPKGRTPSGYRVYLPEQVERLRFIRAARSLGFSLQEIREVLAIWDRGRPPCESVLQGIATRIQSIDQQIDNLRALKRQLEDLYAAARSIPAQGPESSQTRQACICEVIADMAPGRAAAGPP